MSWVTGRCASKIGHPIGYLVHFSGVILTLSCASRLVYLGYASAGQNLLLAKGVALGQGIMLGGSGIHLTCLVLRRDRNIRFIKPSSLIFQALLMGLSILAACGVISPYPVGFTLLVMSSMSLVGCVVDCLCQRWIAHFCAPSFASS